MNSTTEKSNSFNLAKIGIYIGIILSILTATTFIIAIFTPPLSGPGCPANCFEYPYLDIASRWPRDYIWMFPAMVLTIVYLIFFAIIHNFTDKNRKFFSHTGLIFAALSTLILVTNYFVQVSVIQPSLLKGESDGIPILTQFNPHGLFIILEEIGYIFMSISFLFIAYTFGKSSKLEKTVRGVFITGFILALISLIIVCLTIGTQREYIYEIIIITIDWFILIITGFLVARILWNKTR